MRFTIILQETKSNKISKKLVFLRKGVDIGLLIALVFLFVGLTF